MSEATKQRIIELAKRVELAKSLMANNVGNWTIYAAAKYGSESDARTAFHLAKAA